MNPSYVQTGTVGASAVNVDVANGIDSGVLVTVTLGGTPYVLANPRPPGFPARPSWTGADAADLGDAGRTVPGGTRLYLLSCEAAALVNGGFATYS
jgi:hypothetical protein